MKRIVDNLGGSKIFYKMLTHIQRYNAGTYQKHTTAQTHYNPDTTP